MVESSSFARLIALGEPEANEMEAISYLDRTLDPNWMIFHSLKPLRGRRDVDVLIATPNGVFAAELKYYRDTIVINSGPTWQRQRADGSTETLPNFLQGQTQKQAQQLKAEWKAAAGLHHVWIEPVVIFTHDSSALQFEWNDQAALKQVVFCLKDAKPRLENLTTQNSKLRRPLTRDDLGKIAEALGQYDMALPIQGWPSHMTAQERPTFNRSDDRANRERRRRTKQVMAVLTLVGALLVTIGIYFVLMMDHQ
jgi:Nuclease-related domain